MPVLAREKNIVLIGMPGVGKSTIGVLLAKATSRPFLDTDVHIQAVEGRRLQDILDAEGPEAFCAIEERHVLNLSHRGYVLATGGSVVYSAPAMEKLKAHGVVVHLELPLPLLEKRVHDLDVRGVVMARHQTLRDLYRERMPLYQKYADVTLPCDRRTHEEVVADILKALGGAGAPTAPMRMREERAI